MSNITKVRLGSSLLAGATIIKFIDSFLRHGRYTVAFALFGILALLLMIAAFFPANKKSGAAGGPGPTHLGTGDSKGAE